MTARYLVQVRGHGEAWRTVDAGVRPAFPHHRGCVICGAEIKALLPQKRCYCLPCLRGVSAEWAKK